MPVFTRRSNKADALAKVPLLAGLSKNQRMTIARHADELAIPPGADLTRQGDPGREAFLIVSGKATVRRNRRKLATVGPGDAIGEMALLDQQPRSATVTADEEMVVLVMSGPDFRVLIDQVPGLCRRLLAAMSQRLRATEKLLD
jgi:CRP/FNR family transcriptional regulator